MIQPVPHIAVMAPYALAQLDAPAGKRLISLSQNESLRPPSPQVAPAVAGALGAAHLYPDPDWVDLRQGLSALHGIPADGILCGQGSMELIAGLMRVFAGPGATVLAPAHAYPFFRTAAALAGARFDSAPERDGRVCVEALLHAVQADTRVVCVANPGNPTSTRIPRADLIRLRAALREDILLIVDEAYGEFADHLGEPVFDLVAGGNAVVLRSFSKAYGLAGLRVGWGLFPVQIVREMRKVLTPNNVALAGQAAAAAALADQTYMRDTCRLTGDLRTGFAGDLRRVGLNVPESFTNFVLIGFPDGAAARGADEALRREGVILRPQAGVGLETCLRATIGAKADLDIAADILRHWAKGQMT
ncbi:MAG: histidinol-phosphate transaminase [Pseudomonadota bacterium]